MKQCTKCDEKKSLSEFGRHSITKDGLRTQCKICIAKYCKKYYQIHKIKCLKRAEKHRQTHKIEDVKYRERHRQTIKRRLQNCFHNLNRRCNDPNYVRYKDWGGRGIKNLFKSFNEFFHYVTVNLGYNTYEKLKGLQIDRIDNNGHYKVNNIRFVTAKINSNNRRKRP